MKSKALESLSLAVCQPRPLLADQAGTIADLVRYADSAKRRAASAKTPELRAQLEAQARDLGTRAELLAKWDELGTAEIERMLTTVMAVSDALTFEAEAGHVEASHRLNALARHLAQRVARLARMGDERSISGLQNIASQTTTNLNALPDTCLDALHQLAKFHLTWPEMRSKYGALNKQELELFDRIGLASGWADLLGDRIRWELDTAHQIALDLFVQIIQSRPRFSAKHIANIRTLLDKLRRGSSELARFIVNHPSYAGDVYSTGPVNYSSAQEIVALHIRSIIEGPLIYLQSRFPHLRPETKGLLDKVSKNELTAFATPYLNWLVIAETFPTEIRKPGSGENGLGAKVAKLVDPRHDTSSWVDAMKDLFYLQHPQPAQEPELRDMVTAPSHQRAIEARIWEKINNAFWAIVGAGKKPLDRAEDGP